MLTSLVGYAADYLIGKAVEKVGAQFKSSVIERWSRRRAEEFIRTFCRVVAEGKDESAINTSLDEVMTNEQASECLFDAYRRVALSASPILGPRIIALVTAKIIAENRQPTITEEQVLAAAEKMTDPELIKAREWFFDHVNKYYKNTHGYYFDAGTAEDVASVDLWDGWGPAFAKLQSVGLITVNVAVRCQEEELEYRQKVTSKVQLATDMYYQEGYEQLAELVRRAEAVSQPVVK